MRRSIEEMFRLSLTPNPFKVGDRVRLVAPYNVYNIKGDEVALGTVFTITNLDKDWPVTRLCVCGLDGSWHHSRFILAKIYPKRR